MIFWKIDDETIRCLINRQEIDNMGYDLESLSADARQMEAFLEAIVQNSMEYIDWHTENGIQNYMARALPADQFLITISCTFQDEIIDRNLDQIHRMTEALNSKISRERLEKIASLSGEEKEKAFAELSQDLHDVCSGDLDIPETDHEEIVFPEDSSADDSSVSKDKTDVDREELPDRKLTFRSLDELILFSGMLNKRMLYTSTLYRCEEQYTLLVRFDKCEKDADAVSFILAAEEYGGVCEPVHYDQHYLMEHGRVILRDNALEILASM